MPGLRPRLLIVPLAAAVALAAFAGPAPTCPFCGAINGKTLTGEVNDASMVLFGTLREPTLTKGDLNEGTTKLYIETAIKKHDILNDRNVARVDGKGKYIVLDRYIPNVDGERKYKFLVFCDVYKGKIDPYRGVSVPASSDIAKYLDGALKVKDAKPADRLRFFFDYLDSSDTEVSNDAYKEFAAADYRDYKDMARHLPPDRIAKWLTDSKTPGFRYGLYASMLGHCGKDEHAKVLRGMLEDPERKALQGVDGILAGYVMLRPKEGWAYLRGILADPSKEFNTRHAALRAVRFFHELRPDVVPPKELVEAACLLLAQPDIADIAVEDLRKWKVWDVSDRVLALAGKESHDVPIVKRSILRYALSCPKPEAQKYVAAQRAKDPEGVADIEELLKLETSSPAPPNPGAAAAKNKK
ncbi:MAG TPA: hypothetical protein VFA26_22250 [Gemmataceae bacterium]|nr:hypothetical protein [Gemmataceae bacterium]